MASNRSINRKKNFLRKIKFWVFSIESHIGEPIYSILVYLFNKWIQLINPDRVQHLGDDNPDVIFYVIQIEGKKLGFASFVCEIIGYLNIIKDKGYVPIIDLRGSQNIGIYDQEKGGNPWEYYYLQPLSKGKRYSTSDVYHSRNVIFCNKRLITLYKRLSPYQIRKRHEMTKLLVYNEVTAFEFDEYEKEIINGTDIVGAYYRGTDYKPDADIPHPGLPIPPTIESFAAELRQYLDELNCRRLFFMSDEQEAVEYIRDYFRKYDLFIINHPRYCGFRGGGV